MERRMKYLKEKRKILASHTSQFFTRHLSQRGFSGYVSFDHNEETLELIVSTTNLSCGVKLGTAWRRKIVSGCVLLQNLDFRSQNPDFKCAKIASKRILTPSNLSLVFLSFCFLAGNPQKGLKTVLKDSGLARARIITKKGHCSLKQRCKSFFLDLPTKR